jgi:hypothetical protein
MDFPYAILVLEGSNNVVHGALILEEFINDNGKGWPDVQHLSHWPFA